MLSSLRRRVEKLVREAEDYVCSVRELRSQLAQQRDALPLHDDMRTVLTEVLKLTDRELCDSYLAAIYPNPERLGCPSHETLVGLAIRDDQTEPEWDHILECFPCILDVRRINEAEGVPSGTQVPEHVPSRRARRRAEL